jgi:FMN-dependent dehydrogenase
LSQQSAVANIGGDIRFDCADSISTQERCTSTPTPQYGDYQWDICLSGLQGKLPKYPVDYPSLERAAAEVLPSWVYSYVGYGAGDGHTQQANIEAFSCYGIVPRMLVGATGRDLSVSLFDMQLPNRPGHAQAVGAHDQGLLLRLRRHRNAHRRWRRW